MVVKLQKTDTHVALSSYCSH